jgi:succinoglycan biosynthesis transport protein ExoP
MPEFRGHNDLRSYLRVLWRWKWLFLAFVVICPLAAYLLERGKPNVYESSALVGVNSETVNVSGLSSVGGFSTTNITAIAELVTTSPVADVAAGLMHPRANPSQLASEVTASGDPTTNFLTITAQDQNPVRAAEIANAFAKAIGFDQQQQAVQQIKAAITALKAQLAHVSRKNQALRTSLEQQLTQLQGAVESQGGQAAILQAASPDYAPVGPHLRRTVELGLVIGLLLAFGAVVLAESADRRMRSPEELEGITEFPLLASIRPSAFSESLELSPVDEESFQTLRTSLTYFNVDQTLTSVLITSPGEKEGKTTTAIHLAMAAARAGSNVVLVDADLRRAGATERLSLDGSVGLGDVLKSRIPAGSGLAEVHLPEDATGRLRVLPAGSHPPNPAALMSSNRMRQLIKELEAEAELVVIDTPPALAVSDAVPLMRTVSGVILVARLNQSDQATVERLRGIVSSAHGHLLGVVATGVATGRGYGHYARSYYSSRNRAEKKSRHDSADDAPGSQSGILISAPDQRPLGSHPE